MKNRDVIAGAIEEFLKECPNDLEFSTKEAEKIPLKAELKIASEIIHSIPWAKESFFLVQEKLMIRQSYQLIFFAVRMAIFAVRSGAPGNFDAVIFGLMMGGDKVDWRDVLRMLSIMEDCADRLGVEFRGKLEKFEPLMSDKLRETVFEGYLSREPIMRSIEVMGFAVEMGEEGIEYVNII